MCVFKLEIRIKFKLLKSMCKHVLNAQVSIRTPCCKKWYDCPVCHNDSEDHELQKTFEMVFACKKCKKVFRKDVRLEFKAERSNSVVNSMMLMSTVLVVITTS